MLLFLCHYGFLTFAEVFVVLVHLPALAFDLFRDLLVNFELAVGFSLGLAALRHEHLPPTYVVHRLVLMGEQVAFNQWTVAHSYAATARLQGTLAPDICQADL